MLKQTIKKIFKPKNYLALALVLLVILIAPVKAAHATVSETVLEILGIGISFFVSVLGMLLSVVIESLVKIAQYDGFLSAPPVAVGWGIVRDLCNMFFVLILLIIAFATILHIPNYSIKQLLKRVIIFAILINFSKMICGLLIDFAQVIMLTFVNGFKDIGGANMSTLLGMDKLLSIKADGDQLSITGANFWNIVGAWFLAWIYVIIMLVVMVALLGTLVFRIITLWIYIILSPLAYLGAVVPMTSGITKNWWKQFSQSLITGPILAFFIWLSLATLGQFKDNKSFLEKTGLKTSDINSTFIPYTEVGTVDHMMRFAISLGLLIGGLMVAKSFGGAAGAAAGAGMSRIQGGAGWLKKNTVGRASDWAKRGTIAAAKGTGRAVWGGAKATGRGGLALARTVEYKVTPERFTRDGKGPITRAASFMRQSLMTKEGLKDTFNATTFNKFNRNISRQKAAAASAGRHVDEKGIVYDQLQADGKTLKSKGGKSFTAYKKNGFFHNFFQQKSASAGDTAIEAAQIAQYKKEQEEAIKPYKDKSKEQLQSQYAASNHQEKMGIAGKLAEDGGFTKAIFEDAKKQFANNPIKLRDFLETARKKQPELVYDTTKKKNADGTEADDWKALVGAIKKKKIKIEDLNLSTIDTDKPEDRESLGRLMEAFKEALGQEGLNAQLKKMDETGDPIVAEKVHKSYDYQAKEIKPKEIEEKIDKMKADGKTPEEIKDEETKLNNELMNLRINSLVLDANGDLVKAFSDKLGKFDEKMATKFISQASPSQLANINADSLKNPLTAKAVEKAVANGMNYQKLLTLFKSNKNPDMVNYTAKAMAKYNHPDSEKVVYNITNDIDFDLEASKQNGVIQDFMKKNAMDLRGKGISSNDLAEAMEGFRKATSSGDYRSGKGGKYEAADKANFDRLFKAHFGI